jgi:hypothetical protein
MEYIDADEYVEATPKSQRLRKRILDVPRESERHQTRLSFRLRNACRNPFYGRDFFSRLENPHSLSGGRKKDCKMSEKSSPNCN